MSANCLVSLARNKVLNFSITYTQVAQLQKLLKAMESGNNFLLQKMGEMAADINKINNRIAKLEAKQG